MILLIIILSEWYINLMILGCCLFLSISMISIPIMRPPGGSGLIAKQFKNRLAYIFMEFRPLWAGLNGAGKFLRTVKYGPTRLNRRSSKNQCWLVDNGRRRKNATQSIVALPAANGRIAPSFTVMNIINDNSVD